jgi:hypothetical protein
MSSLDEAHCAHHSEKADDVGDDQCAAVYVPRLHKSWAVYDDFPKGECPTNEEHNKKDDWDEFHVE